VEADDSISNYVPDFSNLSDTHKKTKRNRVLQDLESGLYVNLPVLFAGVGRAHDTGAFQLSRLRDQIVAENPFYVRAQAAIEAYLLQVPSVGAVAGQYAENDRTSGVWSSPANLALQSVEGPAVAVTRAQQDTFNVDAGSGKSINVIRTFTGRGTLLWGARTLAGNSNEWRYIAVRRYFSFVEKSIEQAIAPFLFSPNNTQTWVRVRAMISSFLVQQWQQGALVGNSFEEAFFVAVGLGETMNEQDLLEGRLQVEVGLAVARPAEFIIIQFSHQLSS